MFACLLEPSNVTPLCQQRRSLCAVQCASPVQTQHTVNFTNTDKPGLLRTYLQHLHTHPPYTHTQHKRPANSRGSFPNPCREDLNFTLSLQFTLYSKLLSLSSFPSPLTSSSICPSQKAQRRPTGCLPFQVLLGEVHHCIEHVCECVYVCV